MDRGTKLIFGMLTAAVCLMAIMMISRETPQAHAQMYRGDAGGEPRIVWFGVTAISSTSTDAISKSCYHRLWSDGRLQRRIVNTTTGCSISPVCDDWEDIPPPMSGDGVACGVDVNNDSVVDANDILAVIEHWDDELICEPTYECLGLNNMPQGIGG